MSDLLNDAKEFVASIARGEVRVDEADGEAFIKATEGQGTVGTEEALVSLYMQQQAKLLAEYEIAVRSLGRGKKHEARVIRSQYRAKGLKYVADSDTVRGF